MRSKISLRRSLKFRATKLINERNHVTLWGELTHNKLVTQKTSLSVLSEDIPFITIVLKVPPNIPLQIPRKECLQTASWELSCNAVRAIYRSQRSFSESFFHVLNRWNFLYQRRPQSDARKPFSVCSKTVLMDCSTKHKCNTVRWIHTSPRSF